MRLKTNRKASVLALLLVLSIVASAFLIAPAHAAGPTLVQSITNSSSLCTTTCALSFPSMTAGDFVVVQTFCMLGNSAPSLTSLTDTSSNPYTNILTNGRTELWYAVAKVATGAFTVTATFINCSGAPGSSGAVTLFDFSGVATIGNFASHPACPNLDGCTDSINLVIGTNNAVVVEAFDVSGDATGCPTITTGGGSQIIAQQMACLGANPFSQGASVYAPNRGIGTNSFSMTTNKNGAGSGTVHAVVELDPPGGAPSNLGIQTACYGNCGNPAVSLINTNSTHTTNFNLSITLLYTFQSQLNGQILNVTTNVAKTYSNGIVMTLGIYTVPACSPGLSPFTNTCPAILQKSIGITNPAKGSNALAAANVPVSAGQWVGLAVTATIAGLDLNDTNTDVSLQQAQSNNGLLSPSITQTVILDSLSDVGLWGFITGNTITGIGPPPQTVGGICSGLDCILANVVNSFCTNVTSACQTASSMFWVIILTIISIFVMVFMFNQIVPTVNLGRVGLGELSVLIFIMWIAIFTSFNLMSLYPLAIVFAVTALLLGRKVNSLI